MKKLKIYQVDAFTESLFKGNPAAVILLDEWLPDVTMQNIAIENNLSETAFLVKNGEEYDIRWFTPALEVDLCGHATLASGYVLLNYYEKDATRINFFSPRSGKLSVEKQADILYLDFPADTLEPSKISAEKIKALGKAPVECYHGREDYLMVFQTQKDIENLMPDFNLLSKIETKRGYIVTAPGDHSDFVSRFFAPFAGINEDPVTGSAHTTLTPYWSEKLNKKELSARQLSKRGGALKCINEGPRIKIGGKAQLYLIGEIYI